MGEREVMGDKEGERGVTGDGGGADGGRAESWV